ncbi:hypothetical protein LP7551_04176 [Roseibium album]|nr:hypothetical protein LP7551_04176 [Roseibium album]
MTNSNSKELDEEQPRCAPWLQALVLVYKDSDHYLGKDGKKYIPIDIDKHLPTDNPDFMNYFFQIPPR